MNTKIALLCLVSLSAAAQNQRQSPSWTPSLPEKQKAPSSSAAQLQLDSENNTARQQPSIESIEAEQPNLAFEFEKEPLEVVPISLPDVQIDLGGNQHTESQAASIKNRPGSAFSQMNKRSDVQTVDEALLSQYQWKITKTNPINIPSQVKDIDTLKVIIHIRPSGRVSKVEAVDENLPIRAMSQIADSIKEWRFEPPKNLGIDATISKPFEIDIRS